MILFYAGRSLHLSRIILIHESLLKYRPLLSFAELRSAGSQH